MVVQFEEVVVYCPFSTSVLASWLSIAHKSLRQLKLRINNLSEHETCAENTLSKLHCLDIVNNLASLRLWGVLMTLYPEWEIFHNLRNLEIVWGRMHDHTLVDALQFCPNLNRLLLLGCEGVRSVLINLKKLNFYGAGNYSLFVSCPKLTTLEIQGCGWIRVRETQCLRNLFISNIGGNFLS